MGIKSEYVLSTLADIVVKSETDTCKVSLVRDCVEDILYIRKDFYEKESLIIYRLLETTRHKNLPIIFHIIEFNDGYSVVEEYVHGESLEKKIGTLYEGQLLNYFKQLCDVLDFIHNNVPPIIHRDIKPSNIMITSDGTVKLIDFNAAKEYKVESVKDTTALGTKAYAAPEQYGYAKADCRTDVYCLGATMYHVLTGRLYVNGNPVDSMVGKVIQKCLQIDPKNRYPNALAVKKDLEANKINGEFSENILFRIFPDLLTTPGKMAALVALYVPLFLFALLLSYIMIDEAEEHIYSTLDIIEHLAVAFVYWTPIVLIINFFGIRNKLPLFRRKRLRYTVIGFIVVVPVVFLIALAFLWVMRQIFV